MFHKVEFLEKTNLVKTYISEIAPHSWRIFSNDPNHEDIKYYNEVGKYFGEDETKMIRVPQKHSNNILVASENDGGSGIIRVEVDGAVDGIVTNVKKMVLCTVEADCTPVFILDPINKAIGMVHSGWRGTVNKISENAIKLMCGNYGTKIEDLLIYFGPSICGNCYKVDDDLIPEFKKILDENEINQVLKKSDNFINNKKYLLDVTEAINLSLLKIGVKENNIQRSKYCTYHDNLFSSWRRDRDNTKRMLTAVMLI